MTRLGIAALSALMVWMAASAPAVAQQVEVIVHPDSKVTTISRRELSKLFLRRLRTWADGTMAVPVDQAPSSAVREEFSQLVHERSVVTVEVYWKRMIFSGRGVPPRELADDQAVLEFVRSTPGSVGYVTAGSDLGGVKALKIEER